MRAEMSLLQLFEFNRGTPAVPKVFGSSVTTLTGPYPAPASRTPEVLSGKSTPTRTTSLPPRWRTGSNERELPSVNLTAGMAEGAPVYTEESDRAVDIANGLLPKLQGSQQLEPAPEPKLGLQEPPHATLPAPSSLHKHCCDESTPPKVMPSRARCRGPSSALGGGTLWGCVVDSKPSRAR